MSFNVSTDDIESMWRALDEVETPVAAVRLDQASSKLRIARPKLDAFLAAMPTDTATHIQQKADVQTAVTYAVCEAVIRFMRNPDVTVEQEIGADGSITVRYDTKAGSGIYIDDADLDAIDAAVLESEGFIPTRVRSQQLVTTFPYRPWPTWPIS
jgi:hypothetical protein